MLRESGVDLAAREVPFTELVEGAELEGDVVGVAGDPGRILVAQGKSDK